jgi:hypothetical protein
MLRIPHCLDNWFVDGNKVVSPEHRPRSTSQEKISGTYFCWRLSKPQVLARLEGIGTLPPSVSRLLGQYGINISQPYRPMNTVTGTALLFTVLKQSTSYYSQRTVVRPKQTTAYRPRHLPSTWRNHEHQPQIQGQANGSPKRTSNHIIKRRSWAPRTEKV